MEQLFTAYNHLSYFGTNDDREQSLSKILIDSPSKQRFENNLDSFQYKVMSSNLREDDKVRFISTDSTSWAQSQNHKLLSSDSRTTIATNPSQNNLMELEQLRKRVSELEHLLASQQKKQPNSKISGFSQQCKPPVPSSSSLLESLLPINRRRKFLPTKVLPQSEKKRILITGGAGFVGSHLLDRLMGQGHHVIVVDNFYTGRQSNVEHWCGHPNFQLIFHDIQDWLELDRLDEIYHLASPASPPHYMLDSVKTLKTNSLGTINMLELAKQVGAKILISSTSEVYGDPLIHPQSESYWGNVNPIGPRSCYDEGKRFAESMTYAYLKQNSKLQVRVARIFNTYGPRMHIKDGRVVSNFINQALDGNPLTIYGNGEQTRSFQYVDDLVEGLICLMATNYQYPVNLGNPDEYTINQFAYIVLDLVHKNSTKRTNDGHHSHLCDAVLPGNGQPANSSMPTSGSVIVDDNDYSQLIVHRPAPIDDPQRRRPDISLAKRVLNWEPNISLAEGLRKTINYFRIELKQTSQKIEDDDSPTVKDN